MERAKWASMDRAEAMPFDYFANATDGQIVWVYLNRLLDEEERRNTRVHPHCLHKLDEVICEVCSKPVQQFTTEVSPDDIYRPGDDIAELEAEDPSERRREIERLFEESRE